LENAVPKYRFIDDEPKEKPVARFKYLGSDDIGRADKMSLYGTNFKMGEVSEVDNEYGAQKLRTVWKTAFEEVEDENGDDDGSEPGDPGKPRRGPGRPRKTDEEREAEKAEREADKAQRDAEKARREQERDDAKAQREAEKEGAQPKVTEVPDDDFNEGEPF
jgi:hypothetical protein